MADNRSKLVNFRATPDEYAAFRMAAEAEGKSLSAWLRGLASERAGAVLKGLEAGRRIERTDVADEAAEKLEAVHA